MKAAPRKHVVPYQPRARSKLLRLSGGPAVVRPHGGGGLVVISGEDLGQTEPGATPKPGGSASTTRAGPGWEPTWCHCLAQDGGVWQWKQFRSWVEPGLMLLPHQGGRVGGCVWQYHQVMSWVGPNLITDTPAGSHCTKL